MADISKIKALDGVTYNLKDQNAAKVTALTQAEYDALATKDPETIYMITDSNDYNADKMDVTLYAANWSNAIYTITDNHIGTDTVQVVSPREGITDAQLQALQAANIQAYGQDEGHLYLKAYGDVPAIDIPVSVIFHPGVQVRDIEPQKQDIYSTNETVVGTWIDGKPIYRKVYTGLSVTCTKEAWVNISTISASEIKQVINSLACRISDSASITVSIKKSSDILAVNSFTNFNFNVLILEYTKTTD